MFFLHFFGILQNLHEISYRKTAGTAVNLGGVRFPENCLQICEKSHFFLCWEPGFFIRVVSRITHLLHKMCTLRFTAISWFCKIGNPTAKCSKQPCGWNVQNLQKKLCKIYTPRFPLVPVFVHTRAALKFVTFYTALKHFSEKGFCGHGSQICENQKYLWFVKKIFKNIKKIEKFNTSTALQFFAQKFVKWKFFLQRIH